MVRILIVGSDDSTRANLAQLAKESRCEVDTAPDITRGLLQCEWFRPRIVLLDVGIPADNGLRFLRGMRDFDPDIETIVVVDVECGDFPTRALEEGASDWLPKPVSERALRVLIRRALERHRLRSSLNEAFEKIQKMGQLEHQLIHTSMDGVIANDRRGRIIIFNQGATRIYGYSRVEALSDLHVTRLYRDPGEARAIKRHIHGEEYGGPGKLINYETLLLRKDGDTVPALLSATLLYENGEEVATVGYFKDLTEIKRLERDLIAKSRMAAMGEAMSEVAHSVKNILYGMELGAYMVQGGLEKERMASIAKGWRIVRNNIERISRLSLDMLDYSRTHGMETAPLDLNELLREACDSMASRAAMRGIEIQFRPETGLPPIRANAEKLRDCALNLINNSLEALPEDQKGGRVVVTTRAAGDQVEIEFADTGHGMAPEVLKNIFKPLFTTKRARGTGLGLSITKKIVAEHGGEIRARSEPHKGAVFTIRLPV